MFKANTQKGFTLLEVLLVIAIITILASIAIMAINPARNLAQSRNADRRSDVNTILSSIYQYSIDNNGILPDGIDEDLKMIGTATIGCNVSCGEYIAYSIPKTFFANILRGLKNSNYFLSRAKASPGTGWVSPTSDSAPGGQWTDRSNARDNNLITYATNNYGGTGWGQFIYFSLSSSIYSDRVRINTDYIDTHINKVDVDVYINGAWVDIFEGGNEEQWNDKWVELTFSGGNVDQARFRYDYRVGGYYYWMYEFQFYEALATVNTPIITTNNANLIQDISATLNANIDDDGGEPCQYRFVYGETTSYGNATAWIGSAATGDEISEFITGLNPKTNYHFRVEAKNKAGISYGVDKEFRTLAPITGWVSPSGFDDPDNVWEDELLATDRNLTTYTRSYHNINDPIWSKFVYYNYNGTIANKIRFYAREGSEVDNLDIDVYKDGEWEDVYEGGFIDRNWIEKDFNEGNISQVRIRFRARYANRGFYWQLYDIMLLKSSEGTDGACVDLSTLAPIYMASIPIDPKEGDSEKTYYAIKKSEFDRITIYACAAELDEDINVRR